MEISESHNQSQSKVGSARPNLESVLCGLILLGTVIRLILPFVFSPLSFVYSDMQRHYTHAFKLNATDIMTLIDSVGYQYWLSTIIGIIGHSDFAIALYSGILSALSVYPWYRWMRECLPGKMPALAGYAILTFLPTWVSIYSCFMQETLVLPLVGVSLWMSWRAVRKGRLLDHAIAGLFWGCATTTKASVLIFALILGLWMAKRMADARGLGRGAAAGAIVISMALGMYMLGPLNFYNRVGVFCFSPQALPNQLYYESGKWRMELDYTHIDRATGETIHQHWWTQSPSTISDLLPFSAWSTSRTGEYRAKIDFRKPLEQGLPHIDVAPADRLRLTVENVIFFFFGNSWPNFEVGRGFFYALVSAERWVWLPLTLINTGLAIRLRRLDIMVVLFYGSLLFYLLQQSFIMEGRYRIPWEGVAIAATLYLNARRLQTLR